MALKFLDATGYGLTSDAIECLDYAMRMKTEYGVNLKLTSNSWGCLGSGCYSQALRDAIAAAGAAGLLSVAAAGNDSQDTDAVPAYPAAYDVLEIVSVVAVDRFGELAFFSNWGASTVDLAAPGVDILSTVPGGYAR